MTEIQELVDKLRSEYQTESVRRRDLSKKGNFNRFSEESKRTIQTLGNIELYELGENFKTIQCQACSKYSPEGLFFCLCGVCLMPSLEQKRTIKSQFEILSIPYYVVKTDCSRGARYEYDHWKAKDAKRPPEKKDHDSIVLRCKK